MEDDEVGNDITYIKEVLGPMPNPIPRLFDIYIQEKTAYNVMPKRYLYDDNAGRGYAEEQAVRRVAELETMSIGNLSFKKRLRGMPNPDDNPSMRMTNGSEIQFRDTGEEKFTGRDENGELLF